MFFSGDLTHQEETIAWDLWLRFHPLIWKVRPFVEGTAGLPLVEVEYGLRLRGADTSSIRTESSHRPTWGFGAGIDIPLLESSGDTQNTLYGTLSARYTKGNSAKVSASLGREQLSLGLTGDTITVFVGITVSVVPLK